MLFPLWPPLAIIALLMMLTIMIILIYGDKICARVKTHTERITVRVPRPSLEPMMRMGSSGRGGRQPPPQQQPYHIEEHQHQQRYSPPQPSSHQHQQRYSPTQPSSQQHVQQYQQRYEAPMELQKQSTTYGHREIEV